MIGTVDDWGDSLGIRIPKTLAEQLALAPKTQVEINVVDSKLVIGLMKKPKYSLKQLLDGLTDEGIHGEVDFGSVVGEEVW